jgi:hypothetical protein
LGPHNGAPWPNFDHDSLLPAYAGFGKRIRRHEIREMLEPAMFIGLGAVAVWTHVRFPGVGPRSLLAAVVYVAVSFGAFALLPWALGLLLPIVPPAQARYLAVALLIPTLTSVFLTSVWLLARILRDLSGGNPRGGHPISSNS